MHFTPKVKILPAAILLALGLMSAVNAQNLPTLGDTAREDLSPLQERKIGEQIMISVRRDPDYLDDGPIIEYLNKLGNQLLEKHPDARGELSYDFQFFAVRDGTLNAFAFPGGFIGFHSGLILTAQTESELASVMGHEIGHVAQRHIARGIGGQRQDAFIPIAALILAALAARASPDAAVGLILGGQGLAIQRQLNFSREAEREADRFGFQILKDADFDTYGMEAFFGRLQTSYRNYNDNIPPYLRSHPLTGERIADIQNRNIGQRYKQRIDPLDFQLVQSRVRVLQDITFAGLSAAKHFFEGQAKSTSPETRIAGEYGLAFVALKQLDYPLALKLLDQVKTEVAAAPKLKFWLKQTSAFASLEIDIHLANKDAPRAIEVAKLALQDLPLSRGIAYQYVDALLAADKVEDAGTFLRDQLSLYRQDSRLQNLLAKVYALQGKQALQHLALAEAYAIDGATEAALLQLDIARREKDVAYYDLSVIDARERDWKERRREEIIDEKKRKHSGLSLSVSSQNSQNGENQNEGKFGAARNDILAPFSRRNDDFFKRRAEQEKDASDPATEKNKPLRW
ncbi:MAG: M48 family metalloprotease [Burkholderiaceae bacterium]|nr:M48 family metalloprotease [Burkholderiaceae bacterium]